MTNTVSYSFAARVLRRLDELETLQQTDIEKLIDAYRLVADDLTKGNPRAKAALRGKLAAAVTLRNGNPSTHASVLQQRADIVAKVLRRAKQPLSSTEVFEQCEKETGWTGTLSTINRLLRPGNQANNDTPLPFKVKVTGTRAAMRYAVK